MAAALLVVGVVVGSRGFRDFDSIADWRLKVGPEGSLHSVSDGRRLALPGCVSAVLRQTTPYSVEYQLAEV